MAYIDTLKDGNGEVVYPITSAEAIFDAQGGESVQDKIDDLSGEISTKADTASPNLTGVPTAPTAAVGTNTTQIATTEFVQAALPDVSGFASKVSPNFTGIPTAPTAAVGTNTTQIATTEFVQKIIRNNRLETTYNTESHASTIAENTAVVDANIKSATVSLSLSSDYDEEVRWQYACKTTSDFTNLSFLPPSGYTLVWGGGKPTFKANTFYEINFRRFKIINIVVAYAAEISLE